MIFLRTCSSLCTYVDFLFSMEFDLTFLVPWRYRFTTDFHFIPSCLSYVIAKRVEFDNSISSLRILMFMSIGRVSLSVKPCDVRKGLNIFKNFFLPLTPLGLFDIITSLLSDLKNYKYFFFCCRPKVFHVMAKQLTQINSGF